MHDEATAALRASSTELLRSGLVDYLEAVASYPVFDYRDVLVDLTPFYDCAVRLGVDPVTVFDEAAAHMSKDLGGLVRTFARRKDVTLANFGWRLDLSPDGPVYRWVADEVVGF